MDTNQLNLSADTNFPFFYIGDDAFPLSNLLLKSSSYRIVINQDLDLNSINDFEIILKTIDPFPRDDFDTGLIESEEFEMILKPNATYGYITTGSQTKQSY